MPHAPAAMTDYIAGIRELKQTFFPLTLLLGKYLVTVIGKKSLPQELYSSQWLDWGVGPAMFSQCDLFKRSQLRDGCLPSLCDTGSGCCFGQEKDGAAFKGELAETLPAV